MIPVLGRQILHLEPGSRADRSRRRSRRGSRRARGRSWCRRWPSTRAAPPRPLHPQCPLTGSFLPILTLPFRGSAGRPGEGFGKLHGPCRRFHIVARSDRHPILRRHLSARAPRRGDRRPRAPSRACAGAAARCGTARWRRRSADGNGTRLDDCSDRPPPPSSRRRLALERQRRVGDRNRREQRLRIGVLSGATKSSSVERNSTTRPAYITATRLAMCLTTDKSREMKR